MVLGNLFLFINVRRLLDTNDSLKLRKLPTSLFEKLKACLVAKGFHQIKGIDFFENFSSVVNHTTIYLMMSLALSKETLTNRYQKFHLEWQFRR